MNTRSHIVHWGLSLLLLFALTGCDLFGSDDDDPPAAEEVVVVGTQVGQDFQSSGEFGLSATPLDEGRNSILSENVGAEVEIRHPGSSESGATMKSHITTSVEIKRVNDPSNNPLAASLVFDASGSLVGADPDSIRIDGGKAFIDELRSIGRDYEAAVFEYSSALFSSCTPTPNPPFGCSFMWHDFSDNAEALKDSIENVRASGGTPTYGSLLEILGYSEAQRPKDNYEKAIVLFSDGYPNPSDLRARRDTVCNVEIPEKESPVWTVGLGPGNDHPDEPNTDPNAVNEMNRLASCSDQGGAYVGIDPNNPRESIEDSFSGFATASAQGSITFNVQIIDGLDEFKAGDTVEGTLRVESGGQTVEGPFSFRVPESDNSAEAFHYAW